jgi:hypothetical protein
MNPELFASLRALLDHIQNDTKLQGLFHDLYKAVVSPARPETAKPVAEPASPAVVAQAPPPSPPSPPSPSVRREPSEAIKSLAAALTFRSEPESATPAQQEGGLSWTSRQITDEDLPVIEKRCLLKAEGARWARARQERLRAGADFYTEIDPQDRAIISRAKALPDCFLWMCHRDGPAPADLGLYDDLAGCFETAALSLSMLRNVLANAADDREALEIALDLTAEAQSSIRGGIGAMNGDTDEDQFKIYSWLRATAADEQILIRRYMRRDDVADPKGWQALQERIKDFDERVKKVKNRDKRQRGLFNRIQYHHKRIQADPKGDHEHDWQKIVETVDELVADGLPPSNRELREVMLPLAEPLVEAIPADSELPKNVALVLRETERYLKTRPAKADAAAAAQQTEDVRRARELLEGKAMVMIGGERRPLAQEALIDALGLSELLWVETREHQTHAVFEPLVARDDVAAVILAIRWSSHGFGEVKEFCDKYAKPLVRLPAGYNPNQVAFHLLSQVGDRLGAPAARTIAAG